VRRQRQAAEDAERLKSSTEALWKDALAGKLASTALEAESRVLQNEIYDRRRRAPLVFDFVYQMFRPRHESQAQHAAEALVEEARTCLDSRQANSASSGTSVSGSEATLASSGAIGSASRT
jgi:hypothetical protein